MRIDRDTVRIVVPPLMALGIVAVLVHPVDPPVQVPAPAAAVSVGR